MFTRTYKDTTEGKEKQVLIEEGMRAYNSLLYSMYTCACVVRGNLQWVIGLPGPSETTPEVRDIWAYPLEATLPSKPTK
jgi:hypothetical protein